MASHEVSGTYLYRLGISPRAFTYTLGASFFKIAIVGHIHGVRNVTGDIEQRFAVGLHSGFGLLQAFCIRVQRIMEYFRRRAFFDNSARVHNYYVIRHFGNNAQIVSYKQNRTVYSAL